MNRMCISAAALVGMAGAAGATPPVIQVIYSRAAGSPTSDVPGAVDTTGAPAAAKFVSMLEFWLSPDGTRWILRGATNQPTAESDSYLLVGSGTAGSVALQEGRPFPGAVGSEVVDFFSGSVAYPFNASNDWAFALRARGGVASVFQKIVRNTGGVGALRYQMGDLYTGTTDNPVANAGNETIGNSASSIHLLSSGVVGWYDPNPGSCSSTRYPVAARDGVRVYQSNADTVTKIDGSGPIGLSRIASTGTISVFWTSSDGTRTVVRGSADVDNNLSSLSDPDCAVVDGRIQAQVNQPLPGDATVTVSAISQTSIAGNNDWYARGTMASGAWAVRNGTVIAKAGGAIGAELWGSASFSSIAGSGTGSWALIGKTNNADPAVDEVLVVNGQVLLREGDAVPIDLDGNGTMETAFIGRGNNTLSAFVANNSLGIAPDGKVYVLANLHDASGVDLAPSATPYALLRVTPPIACPADFNGAGGLTVQDIFDFLAAWFTGDPRANFNGTGGITVADIFDFLAAWFAGC